MEVIGAIIGDRNQLRVKDESLLDLLIFEARYNCLTR